MSRYGDEDLPAAPRRYANKLSKAFRFETADQAHDDDIDRAKRLRRWARQGHSKADAAIKLAKRLERDREPTSIVSRRFMRGYRASVTYALEALVHDPALPEARVATVMPEYWEIMADAEQLVHWIPKRARALGKMIDRLCPPKPRGYLYGWIDFDFSPEPDRYRLHMHMVASGDFLAAVDALRDNKLISLVPLLSYASSKHRPVRIDKIKPGTESKVLSYVMKSAWFQQELVINHVRTKWRKMAIPEPHHSEMLLTLHTLKLRDFILKRGLSVTAKGFRVTRP